jgi:predicted transposase YbfD/YdcC
MKKLTLEEVIEGIEEPRRERSILYPLKEVLMILLFAVLCGANSYAKVEMFGKTKEAWLKKYLELENGIPDACTYRKVMMKIDSKKLHELFVKWVRSMVSDLFGVVAIDGKEARRTKDSVQKPLHVVSAFAHECGLILGQIACEEKSNEITAIPKLLEMLEINGCIVTIDAMGTQTDIAEAIVEKEADYILVLKENQPTLCEDVKMFFEEYSKREDVKKNETLHAVTNEKGHGRTEKRECFICNDIDWLYGKEKWVGLNGIGMIISTIKTDKSTSVQTQYFIYSCKDMSAKEIMKAKRAHWSIENSLHWVLDMTFREDESRARKDNSAENFNILRHMVYDILKQDKTVKGSMSDKQFMCLLDEKYLERIVEQWIC